VDQRTDVFAVTAILHEMVTGTVAFSGDNVAAILMNIIKGDPTPASSLNPDIPQALDAVIEQGVAKEKGQRFASVSALAEAALRAFGLSGSAEEWAGKSVAEIEAAVSSATPPAAPAFGAMPGMDAIPSAMSSLPPDRPSTTDALPSSPMLKWVAVGAAVFVLLGLAGGLWAFLS
ncbi:MAG: hypothetical protein KC668_30205, partial [Myxococcales bacterium]|nr:hypothetical protein [Myxococcales bacterium]